MPFLFTGIIYAFTKIKKTLPILVLIFIGPVPAAITILNPHSLRGIFALPGLLIVSTIGFMLILNLIRKRIIYYLVLTIYILTILISSINFLFIYHNKYTINSGWDWLSDVKKASRSVSNLRKEFDAVYFEEGGDREINYLWNLQFPPEKYLLLKDKRRAGFYNFGFSEREIYHNDKNLFVSRSLLNGKKLIEIIFYPNGKSAFYLYRI